MNSSRDRYTVNLFKPNKGYMREEVRIIILIFCGWLLVTFGFQFLLRLLAGAGDCFLTMRTFFTLPFHFWFTAQFLPLWFIILCIIFNIYIDRLTESHSRRRDRSHD